MDKFTEKLMEKLQNTVDQKVQDSLKKYQDTQIKNLREHRNNYMNSEETSTNINVKQRRLKKRDI
jgi:hypothetical protein